MFQAVTVSLPKICLWLKSIIKLTIVNQNRQILWPLVSMTIIACFIILCRFMQQEG